MSLKISELKKKWSQEKVYYQKQEIGTGVQSFVKDIFLSDDILGLKEGKLSTDNISRKNEFIHEKNAKERRRADFYIYISSDIAIPVEVECYGNINFGEKQLFNYQKDFDKQYGILTDGYEWRFYNNNIFKAFTLEEIFNNTSLFLTFWKEYIKPEFYYLSFFEKTGQLALIDETKLYVEDNRQLFFEDITKLIQSFKNKLQIEGYLEGADEKAREKRAIELTYAYIIQFILYKTIVDNYFDDFDKEFVATVAKIHESLGDKRYKEILGIIEGISAKISKNIYYPFTREQEFIKDKIQELYHSLENRLSDVSPWLDIFVFIKKYNYANVRNEIFGYIYENYLKELYEVSKKGQYFTDPAVVNFMLRQVGYTSEDLVKRLNHDPAGDYISLIDPSCGSGTFLYSATDQIINSIPNGSEDSSRKIEDLVNNNVFGLDIEEFPLYLAEMSILMRMLPIIVNEKYNNPIDKKIKVFKTKDSIAEFMDTKLKNRLSDLDIAYKQSAGQISLFAEKLQLDYTSFVRDESDLEDMKKSLERSSGIPRRRFDFVIGNPPYVGYNECSKQGVLIFELMKQNKANLSNIYGVNLHSTPNFKKKRPPKPNLYAFFIALGIALLKEGGKFCYIIPQTLLTSGDHDTLRYHLSMFTRIEKIITFSGKMFVGRGFKQNKPIATSSLIIILTNQLPSPGHHVEVINYQDSNDDIEKCLNNIMANKKVSKIKIAQTELLRNTENWNFIKQGKTSVDLFKHYKENTDDLSIYFNHKLADYTFKSRFYFDIGYGIDEKQLLKNDGEGYLQYPKLSKNHWTIKENRGFWPNIRDKSSRFRINLLQANQGFNLLDSRYKILWSYANPNRFHFTSKPVIWARNQICAIGSENKDEVLYLFSLFNSPIIQFVLSSNLRSENEKDFLVSTTAVKEFVRVPKINDKNFVVKKEIIKLTEKMLNLEENILSDYVDFSKIMIQKVNNILVKDTYLILINNSDEIKLSIKGNQDIIRKKLNEKYSEDNLIQQKQKISVLELRNLPIIDTDQQNILKSKVDQLVYKLYGLTPEEIAIVEG